MPAQVGSFGVSIVIALSGVASAANVGSVVGDRSVPISGISSVAAVGSVSVEADVTVALTGVASTSAVGTVGSERSLTVTGEATSAAVGNLSFTESGSVGLTGVNATLAVGSVSASSGATVPLTGVNSIPAVGSVGVTKSGSSALGGVSSFGNIGSVGFTKSGSVGLTGVSSASAVGTVVPILGTFVPITGVSSSFDVGSLEFTESGSAVLTGVSTSSQVGNIVGSVFIVPPVTPGVNFSGKVALDLARPGDIEDPATDRAIVFLHDAVELLSQEVATVLSELNDIKTSEPLQEDQVLHYDVSEERWRNKLVNQLHKLYGVDARNVNQHSDVDITDTLVTGSVLTYKTIADGGDDKFVPVVTAVARGYGGIQQTGTPGLSDLGASFQVVPANAGLLVTPAGVTQDHANDGILFAKAGIWSIVITISLSHNQDVAGRSFEVQLYNDTDAAELEAISVPIARNQPGTFVSLTFMVEIPVSAEGDLVQIRIGNGDTVTTVVLEAYQFSASQIYEFTV